MRVVGGAAIFAARLREADGLSVLIRQREVRNGISRGDAAVGPRRDAAGGGGGGGRQEPARQDLFQPVAVLFDDEGRLDAITRAQDRDHPRIVVDRKRHRHGRHVVGDGLVLDGDRAAADLPDDALEGKVLLPAGGLSRR